MNNEPENTIGVREVFETLVARLIELETRQIATERAHVEMICDFRKLTAVVRQTADSLEVSHAGNQERFSVIADSLAQLALRTLPPASASNAGRN